VNALPTGPRGRLLALGILALLLAALWLGAIAPLLEWHAAREEELRQRSALAARMSAVAESLPRLRRDAAADSGALPALLEGASDSIAGAALQSQVQDMAGQAGVTLGSAELLPVEAAGRYRRVALRLSANGSWTALVMLLQAMETATPRMLVEELGVQSALSLAPGAAQRVSANITLVAFRVAGDASAVR